MKHLSCDAQHLVKLTRVIDGPDPSRRGKVRTGLNAVLAASTTSAAANAALAQASLATPPTLTAGGAAAAAVGASKGVLVGGGVVGGVLTGLGIGTVVLATVHFMASSPIVPSPTAASATLSAAPVATYREAPRPAASCADADPPPPAIVRAMAKGAGQGSANQRPTPVTVEATSAKAEAASLADETRLLVQTQLAIRSSDPERALALVDEYDRRFGSGSLREEARAARILALCRAGRLEEGRAAAASFERQFPSSPLVPRVRRSCGPER